MMKFTCPSCKERFDADEKMDYLYCPKCKHELKICLNCRGGMVERNTQDMDFYWCPKCGTLSIWDDLFIPSVSQPPSAPSDIPVGKATMWAKRQKGANWPMWHTVTIWDDEIKERLGRGEEEVRIEIIPVIEQEEPAPFFQEKPIKFAGVCSICSSPADKTFWGLVCNNNPYHRSPMANGIFADYTPLGLK